MVLANQLKGALPTHTDLECGVNIDLVERRIYIHNKKKKRNHYNIYIYIYIYIQWHAKVWEPLVESVKM